jgi:hypothetical protein
MYDHRLKVTEQKLLVMQKEVSEVIGEMQQALTSLMRAQAVATAVINSRLTEVEKLLLESPVPSAGVGTTTSSSDSESGREL